MKTMNQPKFRKTVPLLAGWVFWGLLLSCKDDVPANVEYTGPVRETDNVTMLYSDSARLSVKMTSAKEIVLANGDQVYPKEIKLFFYDKTGRETSTLRADSGRFYPAQTLYRVKGNVVVNNKVKHETLLTDELTWNPQTKQIYTDKPVKINRLTEQLQGEGLTSTQDFSQYTIRRVTGTVQMSNLP
jgi:LPS export ABC transporter protein LptC